jgi:hypothetical protein
MRIDENDVEFDEDDQPLVHGELFTGTVVGRLQDGSVATEVNYEKGLRHGPTRFYYESGQLQEEQNYSHGAFDGASRAWYPTGVLKHEFIYGSEPYPNTLLSRRTWAENGTETTQQA